MYIRPEMHWWPSINDSSCHFTVAHIGLLNVYWTKKASECSGNLKAHPLRGGGGHSLRRTVHTGRGPEKKNHGSQSSPLPARPGTWKRPAVVNPHGVRKAVGTGGLWGGESGSHVWMGVSSFSLKKIIIKFIAWGKAEVETSKETRKLPIGTSGFRNQIQSWLWLVTECANWPVLSPTVHPLSHWPECRYGVNRFLLQPTGLFFGSVCKQATGIFHRSPGISFKAA